MQRLLRRSPEPAFEPDARQFLTTNDRTRSSICATIMPALGWLTDPIAAAAAGQTVGRQVLLDATGVTVTDGREDEYRAAGLDVAQLLARRGTVYLLGAQDAQVAPLVTALTGHVARTARQIAATMPSGRLDPPLTLVLDEAALICPIPLDEWTADMGGRNITMHIAAQSRAQLRKRWQDTGAAAILNNANVRHAARRLHRVERAAERAVARARRSVVWARRRAWVAARAERLLAAFVAVIQRVERAAGHPVDPVDGPVAVEEGGPDA